MYLIDVKSVEVYSSLSIYYLTDALSQSLQKCYSGTGALQKLVLSSLILVVHVLMDIIVICRDPASQELKLLICVGVIGVDLLKEVTAPWRKHMLTTIPSAFVLQLSIMSMLLREDQHSKRANTKQTGMIVDKTFKFVWNWLQNFEHKKYSWPSFIQVIIMIKAFLEQLSVAMTALLYALLTQRGW